MKVVFYPAINPWVVETDCSGHRLTPAWRSSGMSEGYPHFYCDTCSYRLHHESDKELFYAAEPTQELLQSIESSLPRCHCGGQFKLGDRGAFYRALQSVREHGMDLTGWVEFFVHGLAVEMDEVKMRGELVIRRDVLVRKHGLNERQAVVVEALLAGGPLGIEEVEAIVPGVTRRTLQRDLRGLVEAEIVTAERAARATRYVLSQKVLR